MAQTVSGWPWLPCQGPSGALPSGTGCLRRGGACREQTVLTRLWDHMTSTCQPRAPLALSPSPPVAGLSRCLHVVFGFVPSGPFLSQLGSLQLSDLGVRAVLLGLVSALFLPLWALLPCLQGEELLAGLQRPRGKTSSWQLSRGPISACHPSRPRDFILSLSWDPELQRILIILIRDAACEPVCPLFNLL